GPQVLSHQDDPFVADHLLVLGLLDGLQEAEFLGAAVGRCGHRPAPSVGAYRSVQASDGSGSGLALANSTAASTSAVTSARTASMVAWSTRSQARSRRSNSATGSRCCRHCSTSESSR